MRKVMIALALAALTAGSLRGAESNEVMTSVRHFLDAFNKGDAKSVVAACTEDMSIIDDFPPHEWHGTGTCTKWLEDYEADAKKNGITDPVVRTRKPRHVDVTGDRAYVVLPADYKYKQNGKTVKQKGSIWTITLRKIGSDWRITGWAWAKN